MLNEMIKLVSKIPLVKEIAESKFIQNVATMLAGNITAQIVALLAAPIITRLYSPDDFGIMTFIQSSAGIFAVVACFRYRHAIVLPKEDKKAYNLFVLSLLAVIITSVVIFILIFPFRGFITEKSSIAEYKWYLLFIPAAVFAASASDTLVYFHTRFKNFKLISVSTVLVPFATAGTKIGAGLIFSASAFWLVFGNIMGPIISLIFLSLFITSVFPEIRKNVNLREMKRCAREYYKFPYYGMPTSFINSVSQNLPVFLFAYFFSQKVVGFYGLANMVLRRPVEIMSQAISKVFLQKSAEIENKGGDLYVNLKKTTLGLIAIGIIPFAVITVAGKWIFGFVFGEEWCEAGVYAQLLSPWLFLLFINKPANQIYIVKQKLRFNMYINYINIFIRFVSISAGFYFFHKAFHAILFFSISGVAINIFFILYAFSLTKRGPVYGR